ncbi:sialidase family protein [Hymenobacter sp. GOD-10R]|uniref:WD40/YVTN/BNR-like repeat-containing protein n=1 Tax=Hymenobacter sp. GOD-10R TaxID=3093922 RepID=UPI002D7A087D|nr:sialidase family protein [Hymenobacter sp. GOD-10R]WRQ29361.1 sialidase family protein [Hymenobacter sp. GOD-10R]
MLSISDTARAQTKMPISRPTYYPRVVRLTQGQTPGRLLASFDVGKTGAIYESPDNGRTWQHLADVTENTPPRNCCSSLWEVPQALGATAAGTLFWATSVGTDQGGRGPCSIRLYHSTDGGHSWSFFSTSVSGFIGLWEPEFGVDAQGRLVVYYSSEERKASGYNQMLAHKVSADGGLTWGEEVLDVGIPDGAKRPGMPIVRRLPDKTYVMTYEICGMGCDAYIRRSSDGLAWGNPADPGTRIESTAGHHFAHAPTVVWSPMPGYPQGRLLAIGQLLLNNTDNAVAANNGQVYMINEQNGEGLWQEAPAPVPVAEAKDNPCPNYSSQLIPAADGLTVLEIALKFEDNACHAFYHTAPLPSTELIKRVKSSKSNVKKKKL